MMDSHMVGDEQVPMARAAQYKGLLDVKFYLEGGQFVRGENNAIYAVSHLGVATHPTCYLAIHTD